MAASATFALKPVSGSGGVVCSWSLLIRGTQRARCQAETPLIVLSRFVRPALSRDWTNSLALDQFSLILGAHVLKTYAGLPPLDVKKRGGLAPWQGRRATEMISENLEGNIRLCDLARECGLSVSHFTRA